MCPLCSATHFHTNDNRLVVGTSGLRRLPKAFALDDTRFEFSPGKPRYSHVLVKENFPSIMSGLLGTFAGKVQSGSVQLQPSRVSCTFCTRQVEMEWNVIFLLVKRFESSVYRDNAGSRFLLALSRIAPPVLESLLRGAADLHIEKSRDTIRRTTDLKAIR